MGFTPQDVRRMSMWSFFAAREGYIRANDPDAGKELSEAEAEELWSWVQG